jgi:hypothetical protein
MLMLTIMAVYLFNLRNISSQEDLGFGGTVSVQCLRNGVPFPCSQPPPVIPFNTSSDKIFTSFSNQFTISVVKITSPTTSATTPSPSTSDSSASSSNSGGGGGALPSPLTTTTTATTAQTSATTRTTVTTRTTTATSTSQAETNQPTGFFALSNISISAIVIAVIIISVVGFLILRHFDFLASL